MNRAITVCGRKRYCAAWFHTDRGRSPESLTFNVSSLDLVRIAGIVALRSSLATRVSGISGFRWRARLDAPLCPERSTLPKLVPLSRTYRQPIPPFIVTVPTAHFICGHRTLKAPHPVRSAKLSKVSPSHYCGGGPRGNPRCCSFLFCLFPFVSKRINASAVS